MPNKCSAEFNYLTNLVEDNKLFKFLKTKKSVVEPEFISGEKTTLKTKFNQRLNLIKYKLLSQKQIDQIFLVLSKKNPSPTTELEFLDNFTLLVAVVLSAQSTDIAVNKATKELFKIAKTPQQIIALGEEKLKNYISKIGLFNSKAANIIKLCGRLIENFNSEVPNNFEDLISLPGVGRKTANVVLNCAWGKPTIAVDTHVFRVANRLGIVTETTPEKCELALLKKIPKKWQNHAHHWLILHGRYVCKARQPKCGDCEISKFCNFLKKQNSDKD